MDTKDIHEYVKQQEAAFILPITVPGTDWEWNMKEHIRLTTLYKHSQFSVGNDAKSRDDKPNKNIIRPILNLQYRTEGFDVKDITLYIDDSKQFFKSFLVKRFHERWAVENKIDTLIDDVNESIVDYGGSLLRDVSGKCPEMIPLTTIAFCDQTNMKKGPIGIKHFFDPSELQEYAAVGWGDKANGADVTIEEAIVLAKSEKASTNATDGKKDKTPGKYIECYEVVGTLPQSWLKKGGSPDKYVYQMHILMYYTDKDGKKQGLTLYAGRAAKNMFKVVLRDKIFGRALGFGGVEELFDAQVWTNYSEIAKKGLLDAATKIILKTTDMALKQRHPKGLKDMDNLDILEIEKGESLDQVNTQPVNMALFDKAVADWENHARTLGSANDVSLGENPTSGTPFKLQNLVTAEGHGLHEFRRGKYASFIGNEVYKDWVLPHITEDILKGKTFLETLDLKELQQIADSLVVCEVNKVVKEKILNGEEIVPADIDRLKAEIRQQFMKKGATHFLEIFKDEMKDAPIVVKVDVIGKNKNLDKVTDKLVNIYRQVFANPAILNDRRAAELFNQIIEYSGLSPIDFDMSTPAAPTPSPLAPAAGGNIAAPAGVIPTPTIA